MRDDPSVVALVTRARDGDKDAWDELVERYAPLVWAICRRYGLSRQDSDDVGGSVWLRLVEHLPSLREPAALPGWLATTTRRECLRVLRTVQRHQRLEDELDPETSADTSVAIEQEVLTAERNIALRAAFAQLQPHCQRLLSMLLQDPPIPYAEISARLEMPIGGIGPNRKRCLAKLRNCPALAALIEAEGGNTTGGETRDQPVVGR
jgi:RNA polymerase sigma factor (sigma-70 family)